MKTEASLTRRQFIQHHLRAALAAASFPLVVPGSVLGAEGNVAPSNRIAIGCIGVGPQGRGDLGNFLNQPDARVVALCDVARRNLDQAVNQVQQRYAGQGCATYHDFRELLGRKDIDAVLIATPDHWHVGVAVAAAKAGKDIYLEKPMGLSVAEDQMLRQVVRAQKRVFQFGTQQRSSWQFRLACELVRNGRIGKLKQINVWCAASRPGGPTKPVPAPDGLDYERWLGPAPETPYTDGKAFDDDPPGGWKTWWFNYDYALGFIAGWGVHPLDIAYWGHPEMLKGPLEVEGRAVFPTQGACNTAVAWDVNFTGADGVRMTFRGGRNNYEPVTAMNDFRLWAQKYGRCQDHGTAFEGTDGWVLVDRGAIQTSPQRLEEEKFGPTEPRLLQSSNHVRNFLDAVRSRSRTVCPIEEAVQADVLCHLSDIATRLNRRLTWDPAREEFVGDAEANRRLAMRPRRMPWTLS
ncbi:MAG: Gfo/Idh/MocA family oxidoreductase [Verrucomicrobia bacterium]|nr:Gfo/Idh/MocA family oxidoreductase [Verrucomicrobiota bacterium]